jgi:DNA gyrase/topoisomerase IV subunit B
MVSTEVERDMEVDIALKWGMGFDTTLRSFVNIIATPKGGTHVQGFERAITKAFNEAMRSAGFLKKNEADVIKDDVMEGLTAVVTVRMSEPQFEGQTKEVLGTAAATRIVSAVVADKLKEFLFETRIITEITTNYRVDHAGLGFFHAPPLHAIVLSLKQDGQALGFAQFFNLIGEDNHGLFLNVGSGKDPISDS